MQIRRFSRLFKYARENSRFYANYYSGCPKNLSFSKREDLKSIPIVSKNELRQAGLSTVIPNNFDKSSLVYCTTSGSTGAPFDLAYSKYSNLTAYARVFYIMRKAAHYSPFKKMTVLSKYDRDKEFNVEKNISFVKKVQNKFGIFSRQLISVFDSPQSIYDQIKQYSPYLLYSSSSAVEILANYLEENGLELNIPAIVLIAEPLSLAQFQKFQKIFHATVVDIYGAKESPSLGYEVNKEGIFHLFPNSALVEVVDIKKTEFGEKGILVVTNLINKCQPFIRYNLNDFIDAESGSDPVRTIGHVVGRVSDILSLPDGRKVFHYCISQRYIDFHKALQYKFVQVGDGPIKMQVLPNPSFSLHEIEQDAKERWNISYSDYPLTVEFVDYFDIDSNTGKFKVIERKQTTEYE